MSYGLWYQGGNGSRASCCGREGMSGRSLTRPYRPEIVSQLGLPDASYASCTQTSAESRSSMMTYWFMRKQLTRKQLVVGQI